MRIVRYSVACILLTIFSLIYICWFERDVLSVSFLDVGQGDSTYIRTPSGVDILIDAGPDLIPLHRLGRRMPWYDRQLELLVLTHPDADHITGAGEILRRYEVKYVLMPDMENDTPVFQAMQEEIARQHTEVHFASFGECLEFAQARFTILNPSVKGREDDQKKTHSRSSTNDASLVMLLEYGESIFLFTGDASRGVEKILLDSDSLSKVDVLKVAHHGSNTSTHWEFLQQVRPEFAVISVGKDNRFGHPHPAVLKRLQDIGATILRTDIHGTIDVECNLYGCYF